MLTNRHGLPEVIVRALQKADAEYDGHGSDATVSSLHEPPRVRLLKQKFKGEISADVSERINSLLGTAFHHVAEMAAAGMNSASVEKRVHADVLGWDVSGKYDYFDETEKHLRDWKVLSVWSITLGNAIEEYTKKLNTYAYLMRQNGIEVKKVSIVVLFRDWQAREARRNADYPQQQCIEYELKLWPEVDAWAYVETLVAIHQMAQQGYDADGILPNCTDEEKWAKPTTYAVMKKGNKRASKVCEHYGDAIEAANAVGAAVETRLGELTRCMHFCPCRSVCSVGISLEMAAEAAF